MQEEAEEAEEEETEAQEVTGLTERIGMIKERLVKMMITLKGPEAEALEGREDPGTKNLDRLEGSLMKTPDLEEDSQGEEETEDQEGHLDLDHRLNLLSTLQTQSKELTPGKVHKSN